MSLHSKVHTRNNVNTFYITKTLTLCSFLLMPLLTDYCIVYNTLVLNYIVRSGLKIICRKPPRILNEKYYFFNIELTHLQH